MTSGHIALRKAAEMALEALDSHYRIDGAMDISNEKKGTTFAIAALREVLAQSEQEPVAWMSPHRRHHCPHQGCKLHPKLDGLLHYPTLSPPHTNPPKAGWWYRKSRHLRCVMRHLRIGMGNSVAHHSGAPCSPQHLNTRNNRNETTA